MPTTHTFLQIDAFTSEPLTGNACAVVFDADDLDGKTMQAIAREMNLSETAFLRRSAVADFGARYFTPTVEIPLAGHPTIAVACALVSSGRLKLHEAETTFSLELPVGPIRVDVTKSATDSGFHEASMWQMQPVFGATYAADEVLPIFGLSKADALPGAPVQTVSTGTLQLMLPLRDLAALRRVQIDQPALAAFCERTDNEFFSTHLFCPAGATKQGRTFARHFTNPPGLFEDPFTGSATGGMGAYLWHHGLIDSPRFVAEQGHWMGRPGRARVEVVGPPDAIQTVKVGGPAVVVLRGELLI